MIFELLSQIIDAMGNFFGLYFLTRRCHTHIGGNTKRSRVWWVVTQMSIVCHVKRFWVLF